MNRRLALLQPYPFERLRALLAQPASAVGAGGEGSRPAPPSRFVNLSIGEPRHATPAPITAALTGALAGLSAYPATAGSPALREAIAAWIGWRHQVPVDPGSELLPVNGSREALFAFAQTIIDPVPGALVVAPNPFYQIYEGAALLAGAQVHLVDQSPQNDLRCNWGAVPAEVWARTQLVFVCSPGNPTGAVMSLAEWQQLFELSDRHGFVIASDECYSEIYLDESAPPLSGLAASTKLGRRGHERLMMFSSLSKRSNVPGMRSGFVAGDASLISAFLKYRTYHGSAMNPAVQAASIAAWQDEQHVVENRRLYQAKFDAVVPLVQAVVPVRRPEAGFYLWLPVPDGDDCRFTWRLFHELNTMVLPGSFLGRRSDSSANPGAGFIRVALVEDLEACVEGVRRICSLLSVAF
ncbi:MAG: succinyldiaminopimelate transaminase [Lautropia sp.]|nr:succinyldiaminopimelate transaminase [Lautropia sp.]